MEIARNLFWLVRSKSMVYSITYTSVLLRVCFDAETRVPFFPLLGGQRSSEMMRCDESRKSSPMTLARENGGGTCVVMTLKLTSELLFLVTGSILREGSGVRSGATKHFERNAPI